MQHSRASHELAYGLAGISLALLQNLHLTMRHAEAYHDENSSQGIARTLTTIIERPPAQRGSAYLHHTRGKQDKHTRKLTGAPGQKHSQAAGRAPAQ